MFVFFSSFLLQMYAYLDCSTILLYDSSQANRFVGFGYPSSPRASKSGYASYIDGDDMGGDEEGPQHLPISAIFSEPGPGLATQSLRVTNFQLQALIFLTTASAATPTSICLCSSAPVPGY
jgi:hypothetical protein